MTTVSTTPHVDLGPIQEQLDRIESSVNEFRKEVIGYRK